MPKINSIVALAKNEPLKEVLRPNSEEKKRQMKSIERLIVNRNGISKSILEPKKETETSKPVTHGK